MRSICLRGKVIGAGTLCLFPMDENYLLTATRYIELNPVKAGLVKSPEKYLWSSTQAHIAGLDDDLVRVKPLLRMVTGVSLFPFLPRRRIRASGATTGIRLSIVWKIIHQEF
jgi:hypothetical protein